jgi:hypothetical protein
MYIKTADDKMEILGLPTIQIVNILFCFLLLMRFHKFQDRGHYPLLSNIDHTIDPSRRVFILPTGTRFRIKLFPIKSFLVNLGLHGRSTTAIFLGQEIRQSFRNDFLSHV